MTRKKYCFALDVTQYSTMNNGHDYIKVRPVNHHWSYFSTLTNKLVNWCEKPLAIIAAMAFLFVWTVAAVQLDLPVIAYLLVNLALWTLTLLTVLLVHNAQKQDIRALQARMEALANETARRPVHAAEQFTEDELFQVRDMLKRSATNGEGRKFPDRDQRPSLF